MYGDDSDDDGDEKEYVDEHADKNADLGSTRYEKSPETVSVLRCARKDGNDCVDDDDDDGDGDDDDDDGDGDGDARDAYDDAHGQTKSDVDAVRSHGDDDDLRNEGSWSMNH